MALCIPVSVKGATLVTLSRSYANGTVAVYQCTSGYVMSGSPFITCNNGTWTGKPMCNKQDTNNIRVEHDDTSNFSFDTFPDWLAYVIAAVCGTLILLVATCILVWCCQLWGCYEAGRLFGEHKGYPCCCSRNNRFDSQQQGRDCKTYPRKYLYDENGRRFHIDDLGRACYYEHRNRLTHKVGSISSTEYPVSESKTTYVNEAFAEKRLSKEINTWRPHVHNVRSINTSTQ